MHTPAVLPVTLIIVSDYEEGPKSWRDEDSCLRQSLADPQAIPAEVIIAAPKGDGAVAPPDWSDAAVPVKVLLVDATGSAAIKNAATPLASHALVAVVEADCLPMDGWLAALYGVMSQTPGLDIVTGLTSYHPTSALRRVAGLYDRGYLLDRLPNGDAEHVSNNGALYRAEVLRRFPYGDDLNPFVSGHRRQKALHAAGVRIGLAPDAMQYHAFGGLPFIVDVRRNKGLQHAIVTPQTYARASWWRRYVKDVKADLRLLRRSFRYFCKPRDWPLALIFPFVARAIEAQGIALARQGHASVPDSAYR